ncbi:MAG: protein kinase domain-containing protein [Candidatus Eiseniibacteriota bacterium]
MILDPGTRFGSYEILSRLAGGGMGEVYRARDLVLGRQVALKFLHAGPDEEAYARLRHEARLASALNHPNICTIHEVNEVEGRAYLAMEYVDGRSLEDRIGEGLAVDDVVRYGTQIAAALAHAHEHGVVHRDLKPSNVLLTAGDQVKVLDFGVARWAEHESEERPTTMTVAEAGSAVGTLPYMSPEVLTGKKADARSDLWSLGVLLHEMLAGSRPFSGTTRFDLAAAILREPPAELPAAVPPALRTIVSRCLARPADRRYADAREVVIALEAAAQRPGAVSVPRPRRLQWLWVAGAALVAVVMFLVLPRIPPGKDTGSGSSTSIAVLPLRNLSGDHSQAYFADGMTEAVITGLSRVGALRVTSHTAVMSYRGTQKSPSQIARELKVNVLVDGSVQRIADRTRVSVNLVDPRSGKNLWGEEFDRQIADVLTLQGALARAIVEEVRVQITPRERDLLTRSKRVDPAAYDSYLRGRHEFHKNTLTSALAAIENFERALSLDRDFAAAYVGLGETYYMLSNWYWPPDSAMTLVSTAAEQALARDPTLAEAHALLGLVAAHYDWSWSRSEREYREAIRLNPSSAMAHRWYGQALCERGRFDEARKELAAAHSLEPVPLTAWYAAWVPFYAGEYDSARAALQRMIDDDPQFWAAWSLLGETYEMQGDYPKALEALERARADGNPWVVAAIARIQARQGRRAESLATLRSLEAMAGERYVTPYGVASVHLALGDPDRAFALLDRALKERCEDMSLLKVDPRMTSLRGDPRYERLLKRIGFDA